MYEVESEDDVKKRQQVLEMKRGQLKSIPRRPVRSTDESKRWLKLHCEAEQLERF